MSIKAKNILIWMLAVSTAALSGFLFYHISRDNGFASVEFIGVAVISVALLFFEIRECIRSPEEIIPERVKRILEGHEQSARLLIRRDLELNKANEKLRELDERKSEFLSVVAHQLRTPLSGIKWTFNMILSGDLGSLNENQRTFLMKGNESNQRMITLIEDMLAADRVGSGRYNYAFRETQLLDLIDNVLYEIMPLAQKKGITVDISKASVPKVSIDPEKIRAVLQNLLENAVKYTKEGGKINIDVSEVDDHVRFKVSDDGIGIPKVEQRNIFNRFYRAPNAIKLQTDGSGLGLFIVKGIVERHGGKVWFESEEGKGSTFYFTLKKA